MRSLTVGCALLVAALGGCGYKTIGGEHYRLRGHTNATLGSYGMKDKQGLVSFEHLGTPKGVDDLIPDVLTEFDELSGSATQFEVNAAPIATTGFTAGGGFERRRLAKTHVIVRRIPKDRLVEFYNDEHPDLVAQFREGKERASAYRIVTSVVSEVDSVEIEFDKVTGRVSLTTEDVAQIVEAALVQLKRKPKGDGQQGTNGKTGPGVIFTHESTQIRVYLRPRITGYQISHLCWKGDKFVGLKTDRPMVSDPLPGDWMTVTDEPVAKH